MSDYRARLLRCVLETGSLAQAAAAMGLSYRRAWGKVRELEHNLGCALVASDVGGVGGGKSRLTDAGQRLLHQYDEFACRMRAATDEAFAQCLGDLLAEIRTESQPADSASTKI